MYKNILVPTDGSDVAEAAVEHAVDLADQYGATIHALYVVDTDAMSLSLGAEQVDRIQAGNFGEMDELEHAAVEAVKYVTDAAEQQGVEAVQEIRGGHPHTVIADYADEVDIDLIVIGSHGRAGVRRALLGSVTERVLRSTHRPVMVIDVQREEE